MTEPAESALRFLAGGGEMGERIRSFDWSATPLGPPQDWPQSLRTAVSILLDTGFPMLIVWGPEFTQIYNDGYRPILGSTKHPFALGHSTPQTFPEIWDVIGPMFSNARDGRSTMVVDYRLALDRHGFREECYFTFSYSAIREEQGAVGGVLVTVTETTERVIGTRRLKTLQSLAGRTRMARTEAKTCELAAAVLEENTLDLPFAVIYLADPDGQQARRAGVAGDADLVANPASADLDDRGLPWMIRGWTHPTDVGGRPALLIPVGRARRRQADRVSRRRGQPAPRARRIVPGVHHARGGSDRQRHFEFAGTRAGTGTRRRERVAPVQGPAHPGRGRRRRCEDHRPPILPGCEADVTVAASGPEALAALAAGPFDLLVTDIGMTEMDGYELIRRIRELRPGNGGTVPAVALTAYARPDDRERALRAGFQRHIAKPINESELIMVCAALMVGAGGPPCKRGRLPTMSQDDDATTLLNRVGALRHPCDLDLLIFFVKHPYTLMASEQLAAFMGYDVNQLAESLEVLLDAGLVTRSQTRGRVARRYVLAHDGVHAGWLPALVTLGSTRAGRIALHRVLKTRSFERPTHPFLIRAKPDGSPTSDRVSRRRGTEQ